MLTLEKTLDGLETDSDSENTVIEGFMDRYDVSYDEAKEILDETKKFLELAAESQNLEGKGLFIDRPLLIIDEMWHNFILHTRQYVNFCYSRFNRFIHHKPTSGKEKLEMEKRLNQDPIAVLNESKSQLEGQYALIYDKYGPETLLKWYDTWAEKYTPEYISKIKKAS